MEKEKKELFFLILSPQKPRIPSQARLIPNEKSKKYLHFSPPITDKRKVLKLLKGKHRIIVRIPDYLAIRIYKSILIDP